MKSICHCITEIVVVCQAVPPSASMPLPFWHSYYRPCQKLQWCSGNCLKVHFRIINRFFLNFCAMSMTGPSYVPFVKYCVVLFCQNFQTRANFEWFKLCLWSSTATGYGFLYCSRVTWLPAWRMPVHRSLYCSLCTTSTQPADTEWDYCVLQRTTADTARRVLLVSLCRSLLVTNSSP